MNVKILVGDARERLRELPDESVHMCVTSPPYWNLRSYLGGSGMIGREETFEEHLDNLLQVFREVWRVLRSDGCLFLNYGDRYWSGGPNNFNWKEKDLMDMPGHVSGALLADGWYRRSEIIWHKLAPMPESATDRPTCAHEKVFLFGKSGSPLFWTHERGGATREKPVPDYKWINRTVYPPAVSYEAESPDPDDPEWKQNNMWHGHDYFFDHVAVREETTGNTHPRRKDGKRSMAKGHDDNDRRSTWIEPPYGDGVSRDTKPPHDSVAARRMRATWNTKAAPTAEKRGIRPLTPKDTDGRSGRTGREVGWREKQRAEPPYHEQYESGHRTLDAHSREYRNVLPTRHIRNVWTLGPEQFSGVHYAVFPTRLVEPCVKAGTSEHGCCPACGAPWVRNLGEAFLVLGEGSGNKAAKGPSDVGDPRAGSARARGFPWKPTDTPTVGWSPSCACDAGEPVPARVLDPFGGSGTVGVVADRLGRDAVLVEVSPKYAAMAEQRIFGDAPLFAEVEVG